MDTKKFFETYTGWLILINVVVFLVGISFMYSNPEFIKYIAIQPASIFGGKYIWTFLTSMFMHANLNHLILNMISLIFIGGFVEKLIGKKRFLIFYLTSGLFAGLLFVFLAGFFGNTDLGARLFGSPLTLAIGASGAIFGLGGLLAMLTPRLPVLVFFVVPMPMWAAMIGMLGILWLISFTVGLPIGNIAHLGGLLAGIGYGFYLKKRYPNKTRMISRYFAR